MSELKRDNGEGNMKILLIQPPTGETVISEDIYIHEPLALEYIGSGLSKTHQVRILDMRLEENLLGVLKAFRPKIVGFTGYTVHVDNIKTLSQKIKEFNSDILVVVGGHHATILPQDFRDPNIDILVIGEGVFTFQEIVNHFENKKKFQGIKGIAINKKFRLIFTESREYPDLDDIPFPDRKLTQHLRHFYFSEWFQPVASIRTSKGCAFKCNFCSLWKETNRKYLKRDPNKIVEELKEIEESFIFFADDESFIDMKRMDKLADLVQAEGIKKEYFMYSRSDTIVKQPKLFEKWRKVGLVRVLVGFESHREKDLKRYNKRTTTEMNEKAIKILHRLGISIYASFIVHPDFEEKDFDELSNYSKQLKLVTPFFSVLTPFPGSELFEKSKGLETIKQYHLFDLCHSVLPTKLPLKRFYRELYYLYLKSGVIKEGKYIPENINKKILKNYSKILGKVRKAFLHH